MNWYRIIKIAAYEQWQDQIEQLSRQNPYPFSSWFDENGRDFLPFLQEKLMSERNNLEEAKEKVASDPHGGPKHPIHLTWSNLAIRLEKNIETYLYIIDSIESGNKKSNKYKFHS